MVRVFSLIGALLLGVVAMVHANDEPVPTDRPALWKLVTKASNEGLPKTAVKHLQAIYDSAVADEAWPEAVKAYCTRVRTEGEINQPLQPYIIRKLQAEVPKMPAGVKPIMQVIQADWFLQYYFQNRWRFAQRTQTGQSPSEDFETWDLPRLLGEIDRLLTEALDEADSLKAIPIADYDDLLVKGSVSDAHRPTLFDFLAHRAISFYALDEQVVRGEEAFEITADSAIFAGRDAFLGWEPNAEDPKSTLLKAVGLYQELLRFHASDDDPTALLDVDLHRLRLGNQRANGEEKTVRYHAALQRISDQHAKHELSSLALALLADSHQQAGDLVKTHEVATVGMKRFPDSLGGRRCFNAIQQLEAQTLSVMTEEQWNAAEPEFRVTYKNIDKAYFRLVPFDYRRWQWGQFRNPENMEHKVRQDLADRKPLKEWSVNLLPTKNYQPRTDSVNARLDMPSGCYLLLSSMQEDFGEKNNLMAVTHVWISDLRVVTRQSHQHDQPVIEGQVLHALTGQPIEGATVTIHRWQQDGKNSREVFEATAKTDADGFYRHEAKQDRNSNNRGQFQIYVQHQKQKTGLIDQVYHSGSSNPRTNESLYFFTDRGLYRPGQTIQFKGICVSSNQRENEYQTIADRAVTVGLFDPNNQQIETKEFRTNEFGSIAGSFESPSGRGTGRMSLRVVSGPSGQTNVRVEEYKRPKFFVAVEKPQQQVRLDQDVTVKVKATAYTGATVDGAKVTWRVVRNVNYPQWWYWRCWYAPPSNNSQQMANGEGTTATDGTFEVTFPATADASVDRESQPVFAFTIYADVTDSAGETRSSSQTIRVGYTSLKAGLVCEDWQTVDEPVTLKLTTETLDGTGQAAKGKLTVYKLKGPDEVQRGSLSGYRRSRNQPDLSDPTDLSDIKSWPLGKSVHRQEIETNENGTAKPTVQLAAGAYKAVFETTDEAGQAVTTEVPFRVLDLASNRFPVAIANQVAAESWQAEPGDEFVALWGTGYETGRAYVEIEHQGKVVQAYWTDADVTQAAIKFPVTEAHRGGFQLRVTFVRDNRAYLISRRIDVPWSNKDLKIKWEHFTSKLTPGGRETWTAVVTGPGAETAAAELVAGMYDASLDAFAAHGWANSIRSLFYTDYARTSLQDRNQVQYLNNFHHSYSVTSKSASGRYRTFSDRVLPNDYWHGDQRVILNSGRGYGGGVRMRYYSSRGMSGRDEDLMASNESLPMSADFSSAMESDEAFSDRGTVLMGGVKRQLNKGMRESKQDADDQSGVNLDQVTARTNLQETAFFYPQLTTDENGIVRIEFEIPEALTKWKFLGLAHDAQLRTALLTDEVTTSKDLMVQPNPPRFLREGDLLEFSVKITNLGDEAQIGKVRLTLADAATDESLDAKFANENTEQTFDVPAGQSLSVFWKLSVPDYVGVIAWKAVGATDALSDGEEGLLPVLSKRILVVESLPLPIRGNQTKTFNFDRLNLIDTSDSLQSQSLTVQMTSNPSWYAVMALPYLMEYPHQCNEQVFNRLYANALGRHIVTSQPKIKHVFDQWRGTAALDSPLEKNEDIRNVLIAETPWLRAGKDESAARRDVAVLFDQNRLDNELRQAMTQLSESQYSDGSWSWFPGGQANDFITLYITTGFGRLRHLNVEVDAAPAIKSLSRLDGWINATYQRLKHDDHLDHNNLSSTVCLYLYGRSFFLKDQAIADQNRVAVNYFLDQADKHWLTVGKMSQAHLAIATQRFSDAKSKTPAAIMASLTERSQNDEELGRFWTENEERWWWYRAPIETQALLVEAYDEVSDDQAAVEDCKIWLLKQKQTQNWKTTKATADAVYALLLRGTDALASDKLVEVSLGGVKIEPQDVEAGTGFYSQKFAGNEVTSKMKTIEVKKSDDGVAWGSVHWQYLEDVAKIEPYEGTPLQLKKALFVKKNTPAGQTITPIEGPVEVGDEVVTRVEIRVDRDMEYVHLKDQRGSGTEPVNVLSRYKNQDSLWYYESTRDTASHFFIDYLPRGTYVFEYSVRVQHRGQYQSGIATLQCMYAPEFNSHSNSVAIDVK